MNILSKLKNLNRLYLIAGLVIVIIFIPLLLSTFQRSGPNNEDTVRLNVIDQQIKNGQKAILDSPKDANKYAQLCQSYLQKVRETADTSLYAECDNLLAKAFKIDDLSSDVIAAQAAVAYGKHDFNKGLSLAMQAQQINPNVVSYYGLIGDGQIELGQYDEAVASIQTMVNKKPELGSYNRVAYLRELNGDIDGAKRALLAAISAGSSFPENVAFSQVELGKLYLRSDLVKAKDYFEQALMTVPDFPSANEGLGKVAFAQKDYPEAIGKFETAFKSLALAQYASALADTYKASGDDKKAEQQAFLAELAFEQSSSGGVNNDYELATYYAQQNIKTDKAISLSRKTVSERPNFFSIDTIAWSLYRAKKYPEAQVAINQALVKGSKSPSVVFHAGMIAEKLGQKEQAVGYLREAFKQDKYFLETHFSLADYTSGQASLARLSKT